MSDKPVHNYQIKLERMHAEGKLPRTVGVRDINIFHDDWCGIYKGGRCNCDPDIQLPPAAADQE